MNNTVKDINIKKRSYYFFHDMINIKNFESNFEAVNLLQILT